MSEDKPCASAASALRKAELLENALNVFREHGSVEVDAVIASIEGTLRGYRSMADHAQAAHDRVAESRAAASRGEGAAMTEYNSEEGVPFVYFDGAGTSPKFRVGQPVRKVSGQYQGPGIVRGFAWMAVGGYWLYVVAMQVAGGSGEFAHVFPGGILEPRGDDDVAA